MTEEVRKYADERIRESDIRCVPGHYPEFDSKEQVDMFLKMGAYMSELANKCREEIQANIFDLTDVDMNEYQSLLKQLKRNKEKVPLELLTTKYRKSYDQLKERIQAMTKEILQDVVLSGLQIERSHVDQKYIEINTAIRESGLLEKVSHAVFRQQDTDQMLEYACQLRKIVHQMARECDQE